MGGYPELLHGRIPRTFTWEDTQNFYMGRYLELHMGGYLELLHGRIPRTFIWEDTKNFYTGGYPELIIWRLY